MLGRLEKYILQKNPDPDLSIQRSNEYIDAQGYGGANKSCYRLMDQQSDHDACNHQDTSRNHYIAQYSEPQT